MVPRLRVFGATSLLVVALAMVAGTSQATAGEFHCSVEPCRLTVKPDGTGTTAHHVFVISNVAKTESVSFTCEEMSASGVMPGLTALEFDLEEITYKNCKVNGSPGATIRMNSCRYELVWSGTVWLVCPKEKRVEIEISATKCVFSISGTQIFPLAMKYHNVGSIPNVEITAEPKIEGISVSASGTAATCLINPAQNLLGNYSTGNILITGETTAGVMANLRYE
jgi:hypothetical protein